MQINRDSIIQDAKRLKQSSASTANPEYKARADGEEASVKLKSSLDSINVDLRTHQQHTARLQIETLGLNQIRSSLEALLADQNNPESLQNANEQIGIALDATRFHQEFLVPESISSLLRGPMHDQQSIQEALSAVSDRQTELSSLLEKELNQISKLSVSLENIVSLNAGREIELIAEGIRGQLSNQQQIQSAVNPRTVLALLGQ